METAGVFTLVTWREGHEIDPAQRLGTGPGRQTRTVRAPPPLSICGRLYHA